MCGAPFGGWPVKPAAKVLAMKHLQILGLICVFVLWAAGGAHALRGQLGDAVDGDKHLHNFSINADADGPRAANNGSNDSTKICIFCHTPHGATAESTLWNRKDPIGPNGNGTFPLYGNTFGMSELINTEATKALAQYGPSYSVYPNGASRLCLSCHDGVSAIGGVNNVVDSPDPSSGIEMATGEGTMEAYYGAGDPAIIDLTTSHPISFVYNSSVASAITTAKNPLGTFAWPIDQNIAYLDGQSRMQCTTCHNPHNDTLLSGDAGLPMWRLANWGGDEYADLCNECHTGSDDDLAGGIHPM